jgi:hypothetical protein
MTDRLRRLKALSQIASLVEARALLPVAQAQARLGKISTEVSSIRKVREDLAADPCDPFQAAMMARQAERLRLRHAAALSELAACQAALDIAKASARPAVGRRIAVDRLLGKRGNAG